MLLSQHYLCFIYLYFRVHSSSFLHTLLVLLDGIFHLILGQHHISFHCNKDHISLFV